MTRNELIEVAGILLQGGLSDKKQKQYMSLLEDNVPHPNVMNLIYWPLNNKALTPEEIVDTALAYDRKQNRKICCNTCMTEIMAAFGDIAPDIRFGEKTFDRKYEFDLRSKWERPNKVETESVIRKNKVNFDKKMTAEEMHAAVLGCEEILLERFPNLNISTYFIIREDESFFTFHTISPNEDWMFDEKSNPLMIGLAKKKGLYIPSISDYAVRKNTF